MRRGCRARTAHRTAERRVLTAAQRRSSSGSLTAPSGARLTGGATGRGSRRVVEAVWVGGGERGDEVAGMLQLEPVGSK